MFRFGRLYTIFGYEVYVGNALFSIAAILLVALLCTQQKRAVAVAMIAMAVLFSVGIVVCFIGAMLGSRGGFEPGFVPEGSAFGQVIRIACISPWAFIGFENISHGVEEFSFKHTRMFRVLVVTVISTTVLYLCVTLMSVSAYPPEYHSWLEYIRDIGNLSGIKGLPAFYAAQRCMGRAGVAILMLSLLALVITSLIGNMTALSRLFYALAKDGVMPKAISRLNASGVPAGAVGLVAAVSVLIFATSSVAKRSSPDFVSIIALIIRAASLQSMPDCTSCRKFESTIRASTAACLPEPMPSETAR